MTSRTFNFGDLLEICAQAAADRDCIVCEGGRTSFAQFDQRVNAVAAELAAHGIGSGDTVGIHLRNTPEHLEAFFAACKLGAAPVNVNFRYVDDELAYIYNDAKLAAVVVGDEFADEALRVAKRTPTLRLVLQVGGAVRAGAEGYPAAGERRADPPPAKRSDDDLILIYTGGTTGMPKGVMWTHRDLFFGALGGGGFFCQAGPARTPEEVADRLRASFVLKSIPLPPLMHAAATWATLCGMFAGSPVVLDPERHFDPGRIFDLVEREKIQSITIVGDAMARPLLDALEANPTRWNLAHVLSVGSGGAVFSQHLQDGLRRFMPNARIMSSIGSSEGGTFGTGPRGSEGFMTLAGRPDLAVVVDRARLAGPGEMGILARVGHIPRGYWGDPEKTAATFVEFGGRRYALTGDQARLEADGSIVIFGRGSTCINTGGEKVFPEEVEEVLRRHADVLDALVVGTPDPRWGEAVTAVVQLRTGASLDEKALQAHCRGALAGYKIPKHVVRVDHVVRSPAGKADYGWAKRTAIAALQEQAAHA